MTKTYKGSCFCGAVEIAVTGEPAAAGYCHCGSCRQWSGGPVNAFSLWQPDSVKVTKGEDKIGSFNKAELSYRKFCQSCGGHLFVVHPPWKLVDVFASTIPDFQHEPKVHVHYEATVLPMKDGLPKFKDIPKEMGGSGETIPE